MKRVSLIALVSMLAFAVCSINCMDRAPAPICPVPTQVNLDKNKASGFEGVDLLVVVDNSGSMEQEQKILATGFFTLINSLVKPITGKDWPYPEVENMRVAIVSSDLGLQYGPNRSVEGFPYGHQITSCTEAGTERGDDGRFQTKMDGTVPIASGQIKCGGSGEQCPNGWTCGGGTCDSPSGSEESINCPALISGDTWAETMATATNDSLAAQVACMAKLGTQGCGVEQQMEAAVRALSRNETQSSFMKEDHLLAILIVSDEEDCSIAEKGLFETKEWASGTTYDPNDASKGLLNTACNLPAANENFLFETSRYWTEFVKLKDNKAQGVVFAAVVGVPTDDDAGGDSPCQGTGEFLAGCLNHDSMKLEVGVFTTESGTPYRHFKPACERFEGSENVTSARPGRRYVEVAQSFSANGYVYSICNADWSPAMKDIAAVIAENIGKQCYTDRLEWTLIPDAQIPDKYKGACTAGACGVAKCDVVVAFDYPIEDENLGCPASFGLTAEDQGRLITEKLENNDGKVYAERVHCPLPKLPSPLDCTQAMQQYGSTSEMGWFYCENQKENFNETCSDKYDNDGDGNVDCSDSECVTCTVCGGTGVGCEESCKYGVELTTASKNIARGKLVSVQCIQEFSFEDENCQENTPKSCTDGEDNDGNGRFDCIDTISNPKHPSVEKDGYHFADPNCCPMDVEDGKCKVREAAQKNCKVDTPAASIDACVAAAIVNGCAL